MRITQILNSVDQKQNLTQDENEAIHMAIAFAIHFNHIEDFEKFCNEDGKDYITAIKKLKADHR